MFKVLHFIHFLCRIPLFYVIDVIFPVFLTLEKHYLVFLLIVIHCYVHCIYVKQLSKSFT